MVKIALDYDGTYTLDPQFWDDFIYSCMIRDSIDLRIVTHRHDTLDKIEDRGIVEYRVPIIYTDGVAKKWWCEHRTDFQPDIWIDDKPKGILENGPLTQKEIEEWRAARQA